MAVYKRDGFGHIIPKNKINSTKGTWYVDKMIRGRRYRFAVPEATTRRQAERAEAKLKTEIFEARYGSKGKSSFVKFVDEVYLPWSKENKRSWKHDELYAKIIKHFFRGYNFEDISPLLIEKFKRMRRAGLTNRGKQRAAGTVNREMAQLSKMFSLALKLGFCSENPCRRVDAFKVNNRKARHVFLFRKHGACKSFSRLCKDIELGGVTFHTLRRTFSTRLAEANVNPFTARDLMGHKEINMTGYCTHTAIETMREAVTRIERPPNHSVFAATVSQPSGGKNVEDAK